MIGGKGQALIVSLAISFVKICCDSLFTAPSTEQKVVTYFIAWNTDGSSCNNLYIYICKGYIFM